MHVLPDSYGSCHNTADVCAQAVIWISHVQNILRVASSINQIHQIAQA